MVCRSRLPCIKQPRLAPPPRTCGPAAATGGWHAGGPAALDRAGSSEPSPLWSRSLEPAGRPHAASKYTTPRAVKLPVYMPPQLDTLCAVCLTETLSCSCRKTNCSRSPKVELTKARLNHFLELVDNNVADLAEKAVGLVCLREVSC